MQYPEQLQSTPDKEIGSVLRVGTARLFDVNSVSVPRDSLDSCESRLRVRPPELIGSSTFSDASAETLQKSSPMLFIFLLHIQFVLPLQGNRTFWNRNRGRCPRSDRSTLKRALQAVECQALADSTPCPTRNRRENVQKIVQQLHQGRRRHSTCVPTTPSRRDDCHQPPY